MLDTDVFLLDGGLGWDTPRPAAGISAGFAETSNLRITGGSLRDVGGPAVAVSDVVAAEGGLEVGDALNTDGRHPREDAPHRRDL